MENSLSELQEALRMTVVGRYIDMAACCLVIFDYLLTIELEIAYLYICVSLPQYAFGNFHSDKTQGSTTTDATLCPGLMKAEGASYILGVYFAEYTFAMRTFVIWQKRRIVWIPLCIIYVATFIYDFISYYPMLEHTRYFLAPPFTGCLAEFPPSNLWIDMLLLTAYDAAMVILIGLAAIDMWRSETRVRLDLFKVLYGEGVLFYLYLFAFSLTSLVAVKISGTILFIFMARCMRSILASKVIFHMRHMADHQTLLISRRSNPSVLLLYAD